MGSSSDPISLKNQRTTRNPHINRSRQLNSPARTFKDSDIELDIPEHSVIVKKHFLETTSTVLATRRVCETRRLQQHSRHLSAMLYRVYNTRTFHVGPAATKIALSHTHTSIDTQVRYILHLRRETASIRSTYTYISIQLKPCLQQSRVNGLSRRKAAALPLGARAAYRSKSVAPPPPAVCYKRRTALVCSYNT